MSLYRLGIAANSGADIGAATFKENAALADANAKLHADMKASMKSFPISFTAATAENNLKTAIAYGKTRLSQFKSKGILGVLHDYTPLGYVDDKMSGLLLGAAPNTHALELAIDAAQKAANAWHARVKETYVYKQAQNKEWQEVYTQVTKIFVEIGGAIGEKVSLAATKEKFVKEIDPTAPINIGKYVLIGGAVYALYLGIQYARRPVQWKTTNKDTGKETT